jgi:lipoprotein NlpI
MERTGPSERCFRHVLKVKPGHYRSFNMLGIVQYTRGELRKALKSFRRAAKIDPLYPQPWNNLGIVYRDMGREDLARDARRRYFATSGAIPFSAASVGDPAESTVIAFEPAIGRMSDAI